MHRIRTQFIQDPLTAALCPAPSCTAISHLSCLSRRFLEEEASSSRSKGASDIIPRGGTCQSCGTYTLWGDVIRGCYRRREGGATVEADPEELENDTGRVFGDEAHAGSAQRPSRSSSPLRKTQRGDGKGIPRTIRTPKPKRTMSTLAPGLSSDEGEHFDLDAISSCDEEDTSDDDRPPWLSERLPIPTSLGGRMLARVGDDPVSFRSSASAAAHNCFPDTPPSGSKCRRRQALPMAASFRPCCIRASKVHLRVSRPLLILTVRFVRTHQ